ncbi:iron-siderophore ABC transporter substrate-binding protein [Mesorhizobium sp. YIM 152430]|uniref:iron-siderophore ABC transporter substrate-binding protein n=1 Tax=Mesorhizobium sp. YIM 152430 TaxID=3031761 RepID=UPI0023DB8F7F|nr:iron-siderophore ABC transporter substrate-binding protein [Mesorhizobium sp. YIM 152430]MDF1598653.1 iron-siderophore ABC transporter substrate-binding protein [Mesorhizobium sp. YIM 152430]
MMSIFRRAVIAALLAMASPAAAQTTITDSRGTQTFAEIPQRVVALSWAVVEQLVELDVPLLAVADPEGYALWVVQPALDPGVENVGRRDEPNVERIAELRPDVIVISDDQAELAPVLERIAPVVHFTLFSLDHDNAEATRTSYLELARLFDREALARERLAGLDAQLADLRGRVESHFGADLPKVTAISLMDQARVRVHGGNSTSEAALLALGLKPAFPQPATTWGFVQKRVEQLGTIKDGIILNIEPFRAADQLFPSPLWRAMPFVRERRFASVKPSWTFGGAFSIGYLAEAFTEALLTVEP